MPYTYIVSDIHKVIILIVHGYMPNSVIYIDIEFVIQLSRLNIFCMQIETGIKRLYNVCIIKDLRKLFSAFDGRYYSMLRSYILLIFWCETCHCFRFTCQSYIDKSDMAVNVPNLNYSVAPPTYRERAVLSNSAGVFLGLQ